MSIGKFTRIKVKVVGRAPIMFDRYLGQSGSGIETKEKAYLGLKDGKCFFPRINIMSFLCAQNTRSATKTLLDLRKYKKIASLLAAVVTIPEDKIPLINTKTGKPYDGDDLLEHRIVARLANGIPNEKIRPVTETEEWSLEWTMEVEPIDDTDLNLSMLKFLFEKGGSMVGFGTFRPFYGKFKLVQFEEIKED